MDLAYNHTQTLIRRLRLKGVIKSEGVRRPGITVTPDEWRAIRTWQWLRGIDVVPINGAWPFWVHPLLELIQEHDQPAKFIVKDGEVAEVIGDLPSFLGTKCTIVVPPESIWKEGNYERTH